MGSDARGAKGHPVGAHGQRHTERVAEGLARRRVHAHSLTQPDEDRR
jgi:acetyl-CoA acetyltransferase